MHLVFFLECFSKIKKIGETRLRYTPEEGVLSEHMNDTGILFRVATTIYA